MMWNMSQQEGFSLFIERQLQHSPARSGEWWHRHLSLPLTSRDAYLSEPR